jgi:6-phosphogluconate dehydrogenase
VAGSGTRWVSCNSQYLCWRVSSIRNSVDAQWITAKKDWQEAKRRYKASEKLKDEKSKIKNDTPNSTSDTEEEMNEMRCILYCHGGLSAT